MAAENINNYNNPLLDKRLINAFIEGVIKTLSTMAYTEVSTGKASIEAKFSSKGEIAGMVGMIAGPIKGIMTISYPKPGILKIIENMLGETYSEINTDVKDAVGELTNMIYGSAKTSLNNLGYNFEMAIPTVIIGSFEISKLHNGATLIIPFNLKTGDVFYVEITVQNS
jgi:chemotaxis protein CheX